ncbi:MAG: glycosyltransferase family 2 protein [Acidimicrobiales bacterium]
MSGIPPANSDPVTTVDVVIVNFNGGISLTEAVRALRDAGAVRVVVVDNASTDDSIRRLDESDAAVLIVRERVNHGYGTAANRGVAVCDTPYVLVMNPDVEIAPNTLRILATTLDIQHDVGIVGPRIVDVDGTTYPSARRFPSIVLGAAHAFFGLFWPHNSWSAKYRNDVRRPADLAARDADWVSGACALVRKVAFDSVGGFDEGYFMYVEDLDLCWRLHQAGWRVLYEPRATATHAQGLSTRAQPYKMLVAHHRSTWRFAAKSMTGGKRALLVLVGAGLVVRFVAAVGKQTVDEVTRRRA